MPTPDELDATAPEANATATVPTDADSEPQTSTPPEPDPSPSTPDATDDPPPEDDDPRVKKANAEAARYRRELREAQARLAELEDKEKARTMTTDERLKAAEQRAAEAEANATAKVLAAERRAALAAKVTHPERVLRLMDDPDAYFDGTEPDLDRIAGDFPEYAVKGPTAAAVPGAGGSAPRSAPLDDASAALARGDVRAYAKAIAEQQRRAHAPKE